MMLPNLSNLVARVTDTNGKRKRGVQETVKIDKLFVDVEGPKPLLERIRLMMSELRGPIEYTEKVDSIDDLSAVVTFRLKRVSDDAKLSTLRVIVPLEVTGGVNIMDIKSNVEWGGYGVRLLKVMMLMFAEYKVSLGSPNVNPEFWNRMWEESKERFGRRVVNNTWQPMNASARR